MIPTIGQAIITTVAYADIFCYPLSAGEIWQRMVRRRTSHAETDRMLGKMSGRTSKNTWYVLPDHSKFAQRRRNYEKESEEKYRNAVRVAKWYACIPSVQFVGISGSLAIGNAGSNDDIDLFFIVSDGTLWISRVCIILLTELVSNRRRFGDLKVGDRICLNMFVTQSGMHIVPDMQNLYIAHEVMQMKPLWQRNTIYNNFLRANAWVRYFLPNAWEEKIKTQNPKPKTQNTDFLIFFLRLLEPFAKMVQVLYMRRHRTSETVTDTVLAFHPHDNTGYVRRELEIRLKKYNIPLDNIFSFRLK